MPYLEYDHTSDTGTGVANFVADANEYPVMNLIRDSNENYRGGVRIELPRWHFKLEQGGTTFKDDEQLNAGAGQTNYGNFYSPFLGQTLDTNQPFGSLRRARAQLLHGCVFQRQPDSVGRHLRDVPLQPACLQRQLHGV